MAEQFKSFSEAIKTIDKTERKYPWSKWTDGEPWRVVQGIDFSCGKDTFVTMLRTRARRADKRVTIESGFVDGVPAIAFQFFEGEPPCKKSSPVSTSESTDGQPITTAAVTTE